MKGGEKVVNPNSGDAQGNGHKEEYTPSAEYEYVDADVWYEVDPLTGDRINVTYTEDLLDEIDQMEDEEGDESEGS